MSYRFVCWLVGFLVFPLAGVQAQLVVFVPAHPARYASTAMVTTLAGAAGNKGTADGLREAARFDSPNGVAANGTVYVADDENQTIRRITLQGEVTTLAGAIAAKGSTNGFGSSARFAHP